MTLNLILETTLRTIAVAALAGLGLAAFRVRSSTVKLAVWRLVLYASLLMPLAAFLPKRAIVTRTPEPVARVIHRAQTRFVMPMAPVPASTPIDWSSIALRGYALVASLLLLRAALGLLRIRQLGFDAAPMPDLGPEVYETSRLTVPVTYGFRNPRILLPADWHTWTDETLDAVLAHERSHIAERDFLTQCLSKINRAIYWANPLAWWLDRTLATLAEHSSDDAALNRVAERPAYAAMLLGFAGRQSSPAIAGVSMARNAGGVSQRIDRVLDDARALSHPLSLKSRAALALAVFATVIVIGAFKMSTVAAAQAPPPPPAPAPVPPQPGRHSVSVNRVDHWWMNDHDRNEWVLVTPHGTSMNGGSGTAARARSMAANVHGDYLWFTKDGKEYLVDDPKTIAEIESWFAPMEELGRKQEELGRQQEELGRKQEILGEQMSKLGDQMSQVKTEIPDMKKFNEQLAELRKLQSSGKDISVEELSNLQSRLGDLQALLGAAQSLAGDKQSHLGELQGQLGEQQGKLGEEQGKLGEQQGRLGEQQGRIAEEAERKLQRLFDETVRDGRAKPVR